MGSRRYDSRTTIFSPEGRLYQVEYALEAISHAGTSIGVLSNEGIVLAAEKKVTSKLLEKDSSEKMYVLNDQCVTAVAGLNSDAGILVNTARVYAQQYLARYNEPVPIEVLVHRLCDIKQGYTQYGGLRPFGVSFIYAGYDDRYGFQLYTSNPSGNYSGWKATSVGANNSAAQTLLKQDYKEDISLKEAKELVLKVLSKTMDSTTLTKGKIELATVSKKNGKIVTKIWKPSEIDALLKETGIVKEENEENEEIN
ncbi:proteasome core particle subunit alpha 3 [Saccharomycopsis crataegensis]|uniref:Proteasome core particle subunit alpha 3 n=1 Tax=Saccharomycopsis crataegensis TaxID=43959 RepID=A0AAV5QQX5_9ASCO|nr:proteasome core particle subunit alpha 3 [Saccharomycopsis crataegensis]